jgi:hypothetical protein
LSFWISDPGIDNYELILENKEQTKKGEFRLEIIGYKFTSTGNPDFSFTAYITDFTVANICHTMIKFANNNPIPDSSQERIIQQMENIRAHPRYRYVAEQAGMELDYGLAIIATIKSFGDESQALFNEKIRKWITIYVFLDVKSGHIFFLTSDRPLAGQVLLYKLDLISELLIPHISFGTQDEIKDKIPSMFNTITSKDVNVHNVNGGLLSNRKSLLSVVKSVRDLLAETVTEYFVAYNLLRNKNDLLTIFLPEIYPFNAVTFSAAALPLPDDDDDDLMDTGSSDAVVVKPPRSSLSHDYNILQSIVADLMNKSAEEYDAFSTGEKEKYKEELQNYREKIGKIKFEIYPNEHAPAHFHVIIYDKNYSFSIIGCTPLFETTDSRTMKQIEYFYNNNKLKLIETWNELRPSNCPVGSITM